VISPGARLEIDQFYYFSGLTTTDGRAIFDNHILRTKLNVQMTRALSVRGILDYYTQDPDPALVDDILFKRLSGDILLTFFVRPGTALYLGYGTRRENLRESAGQGAYYERTGGARTSTGEQFFVKASYAIQI
jgi:hypothetical protein